MHAPQIEGDRRIGTTLTAPRRLGRHGAARYAVTYRWLRDGVAAGHGRRRSPCGADVGARRSCARSPPPVGRSRPRTRSRSIRRSRSRRRSSAARRSCAASSSASRGTWDDTAAARTPSRTSGSSDDVAIAGATSTRLGPLAPRRSRRRLRLRGDRRGAHAERTEDVEVSAPRDRRRLAPDRRPGLRRSRDHLRPRALERQRGRCATPSPTAGSGSSSGLEADPRRRRRDLRHRRPATSTGSCAASSPPRASGPARALGRTRRGRRSSRP